MLKSFRCTTALIHRAMECSNVIMFEMLFMPSVVMFWFAGWIFTKYNTPPQVLFIFYVKTNDLKLQNTPDFWLENKISIFMPLHYHIGSLI